jgi:hypothetical protein
MFVLQVAVLTGLAGLPWVVKPVYGFISDSIPLFGYRSVYAVYCFCACAAGGHPPGGAGRCHLCSLLVIQTRLERVLCAGAESCRCEPEMLIQRLMSCFVRRRRSYLLLCGLAGSVSWLALATVVHSPTAAVGAMLLGSLSTACSDVVVDSLVVERARGEPAVCAGGVVVDSLVVERARGEPAATAFVQHPGWHVCRQC